MQAVSFATIAQHRQIQLSTAESYVAEAISAGFAYSWHRMAVSDALLAVIAASVAEALRSPASWLMSHCVSTAQFPPQSRSAPCDSAAALTLTVPRAGSYSAPCHAAVQLQSPSLLQVQQQSRTLSPLPRPLEENTTCRAGSCSAPGRTSVQPQQQQPRPCPIAPQLLETMSACRAGSFSAPCQSSEHQPSRLLRSHLLPRVTNEPVTCRCSSNSAPCSSFHHQHQQSQPQRQQQLQHQPLQQLPQEILDQQPRPSLPPLPPMTAPPIDVATGVLVSDSDDDLTLSQLAQLDEALLNAVQSRTTAAGKPWTADERQTNDNAATGFQVRNALSDAERGIPSAATESICEARTTAASSPVNWTASASHDLLPLPGTAVGCGGDKGGMCAPGAQNPQPPSISAPACTGAASSGPRPAVAPQPLSESLASIAGIKSAAAVPALAPNRQLRNISMELSSAAISVKVFKEGLPEAVDFGRLRLSLAHISRLVAASPCHEAPR